MKRKPEKYIACKDREVAIRKAATAAGIDSDDNDDADR